MELKYYQKIDVLCYPWELLIVPYGIEILEIGTRKRGFFLLIVPYGIEIFHHTFRRNTH